MNRQFGPSYITTALDRRIRFEGRRNHPTGLAAVHGGEEGVAGQRSTMAQQVPPSSSAINMLSPTILHSQNNEPRQSNESLLDLSIEHLEQLITLDECQPAGNNEESHPLLDLDPLMGSYRRDLDETQYRECYHPHTIATRYQVPNVDVRYVEPQLSKTDRTVVMELISKIEVIDGTDEVKLVQFLKNILLKRALALLYFVLYSSQIFNHVL